MSCSLSTVQHKSDIFEHTGIGLEVVIQQRSFKGTSEVKKIQQE